MVLYNIDMISVNRQFLNIPKINSQRRIWKAPFQLKYFQNSINVWLNIVAGMEKDNSFAVLTRNIVQTEARQIPWDCLSCFTLLTVCNRLLHIAFSKETFQGGLCIICFSTLIIQVHLCIFMPCRVVLFMCMCVCGWIFVQAMSLDKKLT